MFALLRVLPASSLKQTKAEHADLQRDSPNKENIRNKITAQQSFDNSDSF